MRRAITERSTPGSPNPVTTTQGQDTPTPYGYRTVTTTPAYGGTLTLHYLAPYTAQVDAMVTSVRSYRGVAR